MRERTLYRQDEQVTEVRSDGGKLLYVKTKEGYEMKCPRTKQICVVKYEQMLFDCLKCLSDHDNGEIERSKIADIKRSLILK